MGPKRLRKRLAELESAGLRRRLSEVESPQGRVIRVAGRDYLNFSSNNYLGLADSPELRAAFARGIERWGVGSGASRLVNGSLQPFHRLETALAEFKAAEAALLFNSGYHANLGALGSLTETGDVVFSDELNHASMIDGIRLGKARRVIYRHHSIADLREKLEAERRVRAPEAVFLIATETVFSMDGDLCPLEELLELAETYDAWLYLDEAHATGVFGERGGGLSESFRARPGFGERVIQMGTLGKALGCFGAYVAGSRDLIDYLVNRARPFIFTTALPPALAEAALEALSLVAAGDGRRKALAARMAQLQARLDENRSGPALSVVSPILPIVVGTPERALRLSAALREAGFWISAIRPPTVPEGTARLRLTLMATHTEEDVDRLAECLLREIVEKRD
ncbi:MAG: 8-amino-7-oxononanoate synthase [Deltaproteobacteria bacterium]|nr:8-amino-7-oxononanoate synthase [Deltaproteobacteria bacterium]